MVSDAKSRWNRAIVVVATVVALVAGLVAWHPSNLYAWLKAVHVMAVISWMAGMLYLPRLFVYHCGAEAGSRQSETFKVMERRLLRGIINPSMVVSWACWRAGPVILRPIAIATPSNFIAS
jgi:protoporphyrinogen IX oxidase